MGDGKEQDPFEREIEQLRSTLRDHEEELLNLQETAEHEVLTLLEEYERLQLQRNGDDSEAGGGEVLQEPLEYGEGPLDYYQEGGGGLSPALSLEDRSQTAAA